MSEENEARMTAALRDADDISGRIIAGGYRATISDVETLRNHVRALAAALKASEADKVDWARRWKLGNAKLFGVPFQWMSATLAAEAALTRARTLLDATVAFVTKADTSSIVESIVEMTVRYDGADCDGLCLRDDIRHWINSEHEAFERTLATLRPASPVAQAEAAHAG